MDHMNLATGSASSAGADLLEDEEQFPTRACDEAAEKFASDVAVDDGGKPVLNRHRCPTQNRPADRGRMAPAEGVDVRLHAQAGPGAMQAAVEPKARFVDAQPGSAKRKGHF